VESSDLIRGNNTWLIFHCFEDTIGPRQIGMNHAEKIYVITGYYRKGGNKPIALLPPLGIF
jgi:hypothetical protein